MPAGLVSLAGCWIMTFPRLKALMTAIWATRPASWSSS